MKVRNLRLVPVQPHPLPPPSWGDTCLRFAVFGHFLCGFAVLGPFYCGFAVSGKLLRCAVSGHIYTRFAVSGHFICGFAVSMHSFLRFYRFNLHSSMIMQYRTKSIEELTNNVFHAILMMHLLTYAGEPILVHTPIIRGWTFLILEGVFSNPFFSQPLSQIF